MPFTPQEMPGLKQVTVERLHTCDYPLCTKTAHYDARCADGRWGYLCDAHAEMNHIRLGTGWGQRLIPRP